MADKIDHSPDIVVQANSVTIFSLVSAFSVANYQPPNWHTNILPAIEKNDMLLMLNRCTFYWLKFFAELICLGYRDLTHVRKLLTTDYLDRYFLVHHSNLDRLQLLNCYKAVMCRPENRLDTIDCQWHIDEAIKENLRFTECPLSELLAIELGQNLVLFRVVSKYGHFMQHVLIRNADTGEFVDVTERQRRMAGSNGCIALDDIHCGDNEQL